MSERVRINTMVGRKLWNDFRARAATKHGGRLRIARGASNVALELEMAMESWLRRGEAPHTHRLPPRLVEFLKEWTNPVSEEIAPQLLKLAINKGAGVTDPRSVDRWVLKLQALGVLLRWQGETLMSAATQASWEPLTAYTVSLKKLDAVEMSTSLEVQ